MTTLEQQFAKLKGSKIILWLNHPELKTMNGVLVAVEKDHLEVLVDNRNLYFVPLQTIAVAREVAEGA